MSEFYLLGQVVHVGPEHFFTIVSAVPCAGGESAAVLTGTATNLQAGRDLMSTLLVDLQKQLENRGDSVARVIA